MWDFVRPHFVHKRDPYHWDLANVPFGANGTKKPKKFVPSILINLILINRQEITNQSTILTSFYLFFHLIVPILNEKNGPEFCFWKVEFKELNFRLFSSNIECFLAYLFLFKHEPRVQFLVQYFLEHIKFFFVFFFKQPVGKKKVFNLFC